MAFKSIYNQRTSNTNTGRIEFNREFAPSEGMVKGPEAESRKEICLNGKWDFQPVYGPYNQKKTPPYGIDAEEYAPDLPDPSADGWENTPVKVPSSWGASDEFPSYPEKWSRAQMGWLRKKFKVPSDWNGRRILLHFLAVSGDCKVFLNGEKTGENFDQSIPFGFDITDLVKKGAENEVMVGIRSHNFFNRQGTYGNLTYPPGGSGWLGIWQDVYLMALPDVYVSNVFIKPDVSKNRLRVEVSICNTAHENRAVNVGSEVMEWINLAGHDSLSAPDVKWKLGQKALEMTSVAAIVPAGNETVVVLEAKVNNHLKFWNFNTPNLYGMVVNLANNGQIIDKKYERFGWREFKISGKKLLLNGQETQLLGDAQHLINITYITRRFAWSWFKLLKDIGGNAARLHAQVYPECFHDMADEMGVALLSESSIYASSCNINYDSKLFWKAAKYNVGGMVKKYRNHPSVYGWSIENEVLPALNVKCNDPIYKKMVYDGMGELVDICRHLDPTRDWISGDGSKDMDGRLPVFNEHYGSTDTYMKESAATDKPYAVGEAGIAYYATPRQSSAYVGDRAYRSYKDHSEAVAIDAYELLKVERKLCTYCSMWNIGYYGVELLPLGMTDLSKPPAKNEGIFLIADYKEGKPGVQLERIPPYSTQYNPGYDPQLPLYKPLPLYYAAKAAYQQPEPQACEWDHRQTYKNLLPPVINDRAAQVLFYGQESGDLFFKLKSIGIPLVMASPAAKVIIIDCNSVVMNDVLQTKIGNAVKKGAQAIFWGLTPQNQRRVASVLPYQLEVFDRPATSLVPNENDNRVASVSYKDLYFTENPDSETIMKYALKGTFVDKGSTLLKACPVDWSGNINVGLIRSERENPAGPSFVEVKEGKGSYIASTIDFEAVSPAHIRMLFQLFENMGVRVNEVHVRRGSLLDQASVLTRTLVAGSFTANNFEEAFTRDFIGGERSVKPEFEMTSKGLAWNVAESRTGLFRLNELKGVQNAGAENGVTYLSFWLRCPEPLSEIMTNPNVPEVDFKCSFTGGCKVWLNGQEKFSSRQSMDNAVIGKLPLIKGWNHFLIKLVKSTDHQWSFKGRLLSKNFELLSSMQSAFNPYSDRANFYTIRHTDPEISYDKFWSLNGDGWYQSSTPGSRAVFKFYGTGVSLTGKVGPDGGQAQVYIDGNFDKVVDYYRELRDPHMRYYSKSGLKNGEHEVVVEVVKGWVSIGPYDQWESYK